MNLETILAGYKARCEVATKWDDETLTEILNKK